MRFHSLPNSRKADLTRAMLEPLGLREIQPGYDWSIPIQAYGDDEKLLDLARVQNLEWLCRLSTGRVLRGGAVIAQGLLWLRLSAQETSPLAAGSYPYVLRYTIDNQRKILLEGTVEVAAKSWHADQ